MVMAQMDRERAERAARLGRLFDRLAAEDAPTSYTDERCVKNAWVFWPLVFDVMGRDFDAIQWNWPNRHSYHLVATLHFGRRA